MALQEIQESFRYYPLDPSEIRLLRVEPEDSDVISCHLEHVELDTQPAFWALSYVWGPREDPQTIRVNGSIFQVTVNLHHALQEYRRQFLSEGADRASSWIWVDAICIDQNNQVEKAIQVPRMSDIYGRCERVLAWLGPVDNEERPGVRQLAERLRQFESLTDHSSLGFTLESSIDAFREMGHADEDVAAEVKCLRQTLQAIGERPWFRRIWILQEAVLAKRAPMLLCGPHELDYNGFFRAWVMLLNPEHDGQLLYTFAACDPTRFIAIETVYKNIIQARRVERQNEELKDTETKEKQCAVDMLELFNETTDLEATVPHDRIYALLGLLDCDPLPVALEPDYTKPFEQICHEFVMFVLAKTLDIRVLNLGTWGKLTGVPSWTPDLRESWMARVNIAPCPGKCFSISEDNKILTMPTIILGRCVSVFGPTEPDPSTGMMPLSAFMEYDGAIIQVASSIRRFTRMKTMAEWFRYHLADMFTEERLDKDPSIEERVMMVYTCMVHNQPLDALDDRFGTREQLRGADGMIRNPTLQKSMMGHSMFVLHDGTPGNLVGDHATAAVGDALCVFPGLSVLFVLRPEADGKCRVLSQASLWKHTGASLPKECLEEYRQSFVEAHHGREAQHAVQLVSLV
ncbi:hypothetical protein FZEAL_1678 [Fusarium zealandicum]|uniref:Heterokaryon incompatibility domain-containing protein n=1 Tax=Fusarium zealandicum TaxID=1053134 RepID=A0A8H4USA6_9HYPO|nr:hypothetical protein FZEAL_1678 [Fusarium zealandicum]